MTNKETKDAMIEMLEDQLAEWLRIANPDQKLIANIARLMNLIAYLKQMRALK